MLWRSTAPARRPPGRDWNAVALGHVSTHGNVSALLEPYIQRDIPEKTGFGKAARVGADEAHDAVTVLAAADLHNCAF